MSPTSHDNAPKRSDDALKRSDDAPKRSDDAKASGTSALVHAEPAALATTRSGWSGQEHRLQVSAAVEAGLDGDEAALRSLTEGFVRGMTVDEPTDHGLVARGRTILDDRELLEVLEPALAFMGVRAEHTRLRVLDGEFELVIAGAHVGNLGMVWDSTRAAASLFVASLVVCWILWPYFATWSLLFALVGLGSGAVVMRSGWMSGRNRLAARLATSLALLAKADGRVLPPSRAAT